MPARWWPTSFVETCNYCWVTNTGHMEALLPLFAQSGARVVFSGHEHNFQHSRHNGLHYFVTGAGSKVRKGMPDDFERAVRRAR